MSFARGGVVLAALTLVTFVGDDAFAGVKGNRYQGFDVINGGSEVVGQTHDFRTDGTYILTENQNSGTFVFPGTYRETNLGIISLWSAVVSDGSPDGEAQVDGVLLFGFITTVTVTNSDVGIVARGYAIKAGPAQRGAGGGRNSGGIVGGVED